MAAIYEARMPSRHKRIEFNDVLLSGDRAELSPCRARGPFAPICRAGRGAAMGGCFL